MDTMKPHTFTDKNGKVLILKRLPQGRNGIKANTWYEVNNGELTEVK